MADVTETDYTTDPPTVTSREFTPQERAQIGADIAAAEQAEAERAAAEAKAAQDRADAIAHAESLGFTEAMISVMYPNLTTEA